MFDAEERPVLGRYEPIRVTGTRDDLSTTAKVDTGSDRSTIDEQVLDEIGRTGRLTSVSTRSGGDVDERDVVAVYVEFARLDLARVVEADVADRSNYTGDILVGVDLLSSLNAVIDPERDHRDEGA